MVRFDRNLNDVENDRPNFLAPLGKPDGAARGAHRLLISRTTWRWPRLAQQATCLATTDSDRVLGPSIFESREALR